MPGNWAANGQLASNCRLAEFELSGDKIGCSPLALVLLCPCAHYWNRIVGIHLLEARDKVLLRFLLT